VAYVRIDGQGSNAKSKFIVQKLDGGAEACSRLKQVVHPHAHDPQPRF